MNKIQNNFYQFLAEDILKCVQCLSSEHLRNHLQKIRSLGPLQIGKLDHCSWLQLVQPECCRPGKTCLGCKFLQATNMQQKFIIRIRTMQ